MADTSVLFVCVSNAGKSVMALTAELTDQPSRTSSRDSSPAPDWQDYGEAETSGSLL